MESDPCGRHYLNEVVRTEIAEYCRGRWVAVEGGALSSRVFLRYWRDGRPLSISSPKDVLDLLKNFSGIKPRSIYGSINVYKSLSDKSDLEDPANIAYASPTWDIDGDLGEWKGVIEAARIIVGELERLGITKSVFIKWSGEGAHVHVHEKCFSSEVLSNYNPLDIAYSLVNFVLEKCREKMLDLTSGFSSVKVENEIDLKRVFTAPLSLHRRRNLCCVCLKPDELDSFEVEWANPECFKHNPDWKRYVEGEGDDAAIEAIKAVGGYRGWLNADARVRTVISAPKKDGLGYGRDLREGGIGRFQVMALLQAARYYLLTGDLDKAKSFGLNRAIFYAWAKRHGGKTPPKKITCARDSAAGSASKEREFHLGDEVALMSKNGWFAIGGQEQRPEDYDSQIAKRIDSVVRYGDAWEAAIEYLKRFSRETLLSQQKFFKEVYEPVRDSFLEKVLSKRGGGKAEGLAGWL
ncbi:MAG: hypothetical protein QW341_02305 [Candidatus Bathyarchaeia archaeon]